MWVAGCIIGLCVHPGQGEPPLARTSLIPAPVFQATSLPFHQTSQTDGAPNIPAVSPRVVETLVCRSLGVCIAHHSAACEQRGRMHTPPTYRVAVKRQTVALQIDPCSQTKEFALRTHKNIWIFPVPGSSLLVLATGGSNPGHNQTLSEPNSTHPGSKTPPETHSSPLAGPHGAMRYLEMLHFRVYDGLGTAQLSVLEHTLAPPAADPGIISFHFLLTTCSIN